LEGLSKPVVTMGKQDKVTVLRKMAFNILDANQIEFNNILTVEMSGIMPGYRSPVRDIGGDDAE